MCVGVCIDSLRALQKFEEVLSDRSWTTCKEVSIPEKMDDNSYQSIVKVPVSIVGLLLVRRATDSNVLSQIKSATHTSIAKLPADGKDDGGREEEGGVAQVVEQEGVTSEASPQVNHKKAVSSGGHEVFAVRGGKEEGVLLAATCLSRIVDGEKIMSVMHDLRIQRPGSFDRPHNAHDADSGGRYHGGRGGGRGGRGGPVRGGRGRGDESTSDDGRWGRVRLASDDSSSRGRGGANGPEASTVQPPHRESKRSAEGDVQGHADDASDSAPGRGQRSSSRGGGRRGGRSGRGSTGSTGAGRRRDGESGAVSGQVKDGSVRGGGGAERRGRKGRGSGSNGLADDKAAASL